MLDNALVARIRCVLMLILAGGLAIGTSWSNGIADASPASVRLADLLNSHHYHQALSQASALLNLSHSARVHQGVSRYELLQVKGEALLRLKLFDAATDTYRSMAKLAPSVRQTRIDRATAALIDHSIAGYYTPQHRSEHGLGPMRINILPAGSRRQAMRAFYRDQWTILKPRLKAALHRSELGPLLRLFLPLRQAVDMETAASRKAVDNDSDSLRASRPAQAAVDSSTDRIVQLTSRGLKSMDSRIQAIVTSSHTLIFFRHRTAPRGVTQPEANELQNMIQTCQDILTMIKRFSRTFPDFSTDCAQLRRLKGKTLHVEHLAQNTLP